MGLIERLRKPVAYGPVGAQSERKEAADEIERLTADVQDYKDLYFAEQCVVTRRESRIAELEAALQYVKGRMVHSRCPRCTDNHEVAVAALKDTEATAYSRRGTCMVDNC